ncbi:uncharacterized protein LOC135939806 [Cloeon dipterum]|uniref:uncharacterized protein LOC135939806 n=1 Tax=Cloeon dipterum TaxID=197152 RepID=UPI00321FEAD2
MSYSGYPWSSQTKKGTSPPPKNVIWSYTGFSGNSYPYDASMQEKLEAAYKSKQKKMSFDVKNETYMIDFKQMLQINQRDTSKVRRVTREKVKKTTPRQPTNKQTAPLVSKSTSLLVPPTQKVEAKPANKSPSPSTTTTMKPPIVPLTSDQKTPQPKWQWLDNKGDWQKFEDNLQVLLESRFQDNIDETYTFSRDGNLYDINFTNKTQTSRLPYPETRDIKRIEPKNDTFINSAVALYDSAKSKIKSVFTSSSSPSIEEARPATPPGNTVDLPDDAPHVWYYIDDDGAKIEYAEYNQKKLESYRSSGYLFAAIFIGSDCLSVDMKEMKQTKYGDQTYSPKLVIREPKKLTDRDLHSTKTLVGETPQPSYVWYYEDAYRAKTKYDKNHQKQLESCYIEGKEKTVIQINFDSYTVNFKEMKQTLIWDKTEAKVFREPAAFKLDSFSP